MGGNNYDTQRIYEKALFDGLKPYIIVKEDGTELDIGWDEYDKYEFVKYIPGEDEDTVIVK